MPAPSFNPEQLRQVARSELQQVFFRLGYDLSNPEEMRRLERNLRWAEEERQKDVRRSANVAKVIWLFVSASLGSVATVLADHFTK